jgi:hypothetical protein
MLSLFVQDKFNLDFSFVDAENLANRLLRPAGQITNTIIIEDIK